MIAGFFAIRLGLTNVSGSVDINNSRFELNNNKAAKISQAVAGVETKKEDGSLSGIDQEIKRLEAIKQTKTENFCKIQVIGNYYPINAKKIIDIFDQTKVDSIATKAAMAVEIHLANNADFQKSVSQCDSQKGSVIEYSQLKNKFQNAQSPNAFYWIDKPEWQSVKEAVKKDKGIIDQVGKETGIEPRLLVSSMIVEQLRLFYSEREVFKKFFEPLKILCSANKISLGVMGIKEETAIKIETNLKDSSSPYYLGSQYEHALDFKTADISSERYNRLTDEKNHYYSYLYGALYLKQMMKQWRDAGYSVDWRPEIIGTLFNVGFPQSKPNPNPKVGGSHINVGGEDYSFGALSYEFYYSGEILDEFPYETN